MLTLITGTPGAGKTLMAVADFAAKVPGSTVEGTGGTVIQRRLLTNIRDLIIEHEHITAADLETWHQWAKPGDVIIFDEVQEVFRPRGLGTKVPECIAAIETHRHKGVDLVLITQHPMLLDPNIRRLVNQHLHVRRLANSVSYIYEWDHCANPGQVKTCIQARVWWYPKKAFQWYKSAQLHTKTTAKLPRLAVVGVLALAGLAYLAPMAYGRITATFDPVKTQAPTSGRVVPLAAQQPEARAAASAAAAPQAEGVAQVLPGKEIRPMGCIATKTRCECFDPVGARMEVEEAICREGSHRVGYTVPAGGMGGTPMSASRHPPAHSGVLGAPDPVGGRLAPSAGGGTPAAKARPAQAGTTHNVPS